MVEGDALTPQHVRVLQVIYALLREKGRWPTFTEVDRTLDRRFALDLTELLRTMPDDLTNLTHVSGRDDIEATLTANALAVVPEAEDDRDRVMKVVWEAAELEHTDDDPEISRDLLTSKLGLTVEDADRISLFLRGEPWFGGGSSTDAGWNFKITREVRRFRGVQTFTDFLRRRGEAESKAPGAIRRYADAVRSMRNPPAETSPVVAQVANRSVATEGSTGKRRYQVFVSSTYEDLIEEREQVMWALLRLECIPAGMELFPASDETKWDLICRVIDECDYYVVVVAGRYGSTDSTGTSYTEREYDYASNRGIPILRFIHGSPEENGDTDAGLRDRLNAFRARLQEKPCKTWIDPSSLSLAVTESLYHAFQNAPRPGWVRATSPAVGAASAVDTRALIHQLEGTIEELQQHGLPQVAASQSAPYLRLQATRLGDEGVSGQVEYLSGSGPAIGVEIWIRFRQSWFVCRLALVGPDDKNLPFAAKRANTADLAGLPYPAFLDELGVTDHYLGALWQSEGAAWRYTEHRVVNSETEELSGEAIKVRIPAS